MCFVNKCLTKEVYIGIIKESAHPDPASAAPCCNPHMRDSCAAAPVHPLYKRLERSLEETEEIEGKSYKEINEWWSNLQEDFKRLNRNYQDYI